MKHSNSRIHHYKTTVIVGVFCLGLAVAAAGLLDMFSSTKCQWTGLPDGSLTACTIENNSVRLVLLAVGVLSAVIGVFCLVAVATAPRRNRAAQKSGPVVRK